MRDRAHARVGRLTAGTHRPRLVYIAWVDSALREESEAIASARRGDAAAFGTLVERYQEVAFRTSYLIVRDAAAAEDVTQEAFIRAYRKLGSFREGEPFRPWLLRIVTNCGLNEVRARSRRFGLLERTRVLADRNIETPPSEVEARDERSEEHTSELQSPVHLVCR